MNGANIDNAVEKIRELLRIGNTRRTLGIGMHFNLT